MGVLEGEEGVWKQRQSFRRMKTYVSHFFGSLKNYSSLLALFKYQRHQIKLVKTVLILEPNHPRVILGVKPCEVFLGFLALIFLDCIVLTSHWLLCFSCFTHTSLVRFTGFCTEYEPNPNDSNSTVDSNVDLN